VTGQVWCVSMMRDEADVAVDVVTHLAEEGVDGIIVADNLSADGTGDILRDLDLPCQLLVIDDTEPGYYQSDKMTRLAHQAHDLGAEWIVPFDADELWCARSDGLARALRLLPDRVTVAEASLLNHFATALDSDDPCPLRSMQWRQRDPAPLPKVAVRWAPHLCIHQGNHGADRDGDRAVGDLEVRHFPYRSFDQFLRKARNGAAAYAATDLPADQGAHWRQYGALIDSQGEDAFRSEVWERYYWFFSPTDAGLVYDPAPFLRWRR
jgi:hypothetical protein